MSGDKVYMLVGIPGSGKTHFAKEMVSVYPGDIVHLESDSIRQELYNGKQGREETNGVFKEMHRRTKQALSDGKDVIYDATNVSYKDRRGTLNSLPKGTKKICYLIVTPIHLCKERNAQRENPVPEEAIEHMVKRFNYPVPTEGFDVIASAYGGSPKVRIMEVIQMHKSPIIPEMISFLTTGVHNNGWKEMPDEELETYIYQVLSRLSLDIHDNIDLPQDNPNHTFTVSKHMFHVWKEVIRQRNKYKGTKEYAGVDWDSLALAALFHDTGKAWTKEFKDGKGNPTDIAHYYGHENVSAYIAANACIRILNMSEEENPIDMRKICTLVQFHMKLYPYANNEKKWRKLVDETTMKELQILNIADMSAK